MISAEFARASSDICIHERLTAQNSSERLRAADPLVEGIPLKEEGRMVRKGRSLGSLLFGRRGRQSRDDGMGFGEASVHHALVVIFLEYFAWGLLTVPVINVLADTFPANKFLMNGMILGVKGFLSFLSAPLVGALSDTWGRKSFLLLTVFCTCMPIPCLKISPWWYFALFSISGLFSVTFSVVLAYVADITEKNDRSAAYGLVSATFAASLVTSPALGAWISEAWGDEAVVLLATTVAALDVLFILVAVPESLPVHLRHSLDSVSWQSADPFAALRFVWEDRMVLQLAVIVFLSYLPEAGQFSCFFVYLKLVVGFTPEAVAAFIGLVGILSVVAQTGVLLILTQAVGTKHTITLGLCFQCAQLLWYGLGTKYWMMWAAGLLAAMSQLTYPSISAFVSIQSDRDKQGTVQGVVTGIRGLCQGLGPALFGFIFYQFDMDLNVDNDETGHVGIAQFPAPRIRPQAISVISPRRNVTSAERPTFNWQLIPGPPFLFGALMVLLALAVNSSLPRSASSNGRFLRRSTASLSRQSSADTTKLLHSSS
ncbi:Hippocampus abundant transcript 1 protein [Toxocara canis]|uniref:Hippocampus abundant transcript 1 protein n=1 Tax=Toxocara canis TaxID=6265 RepID=A0A0B2V946_TOXCA|nr:Hippocampus abundant transcript 1 protein [Toxocara canis]